MKLSNPFAGSLFRVILLSLWLPAALAADVRINEFMASNQSSIADEDGSREDWIELHNPTGAAVNLAGWGLSDNPASPFQWTFAPGTLIPAGGYLLVWASEKNRPGQQNPVAEPDDLGGLVVWLRADTAAFSNGQAVATWQDTSGRGNHATQPTTGQRPVFTTNAINGLPALSFTRSSSHQLFLPTGAFNGMNDLSNFTFFAIARWTGGVQSGLFGGYRGANNTNSGSAVLEISNSGGNLRLRLPPSLETNSAAAATLNQWHLLGASMDQTAGKSSMFRDGSLLVEGSGTTGTTALANYERLPVGSSFDNNRTFGGQIAEVMIYNRALSALERASLERHLAAKYNLSFTTPNSVTTPPHTNFRISAAGETLVLTRPDGSTADLVDPVAVPSNVAYGRTTGDPATWSLLQTATPGAPNVSGPYIEPPPPVVFSHAAGVHTQPFSLTLSHPDPSAVIIYTLDGSEPDINNLSGRAYRFRASYNSGPFVDMTTTSLTYQNPIAVVDRSSQPNRVSLIPSTDGTPGYLPVAPVKKATVVRARAYVNGVPSPAGAATYFVSNSSAFNYPVAMVSMLFDEDSLFDYDNGIYVAGVDHVTSTGGRICSWGNFNRNGAESERAGHFQFFENGTITVDQAVGFRIHGNCSRRNAFKSMRVIADRDYETRDEFDHNFFSDAVPDAVVPDNTTHKALILRSPSINEVSFCRLYQPLYGGVSGRLRPVIQFFNGEYWGLSYLRDRLDEDYLARHYELDPDNLVLVNIKYGHEVGSTAQRVFDLDHGVPSDMDDFWAMRNFITSNNMATPANYAQALTLLDKDSFIDHLILKIFAGDDHYAPEYVFWRAREAQDDSFGDGRWRVMVKDFDSSLFTGNFVTGLAEGSHLRPFGYELFQSLLANPSFRNDFINRFADLLNAHFQPARFQSIINAAYNEAQPVWSEMSARWNNVAFSNPNRPFTVAGRDALLNWSTVHPPRQRGHIRAHFGILSDVNLTVNVSNPAHGHVRVNTIDINGTTPGLAAQPYPWTGTYFHNIPVKLAARPASGYRLAGWKLNGAATFHSTAAEIPLTLTAATSVEAVFEPLQVIHRWDFENAGTFLQPSESVGGGAALGVVPAPLTEVLRNTASQNFTTAHLRVNNPIGTSLVWSLPSTGFGNLVLSWKSRRSGQGAGTQVLEATTDGVLWSPLATIAVADAAPASRTFDLAAIPGAENNPLFAVRVGFATGAGGTAGNNRFDDVLLSGTLLPGGQPAASMVFDPLPPGAASGSALPPLRVRFLDASGFPAVSHQGPVTLSLIGNGSLTGTLTVNAVNGTATFANLSLSGTGGFRFAATAPGLPTVESLTLRSLGLTELVVPRFLQGGTNAMGENLERVPMAWRARIEGLAPGATYRYANRVSLAGDTATSDGAGNMIFAPNGAGPWIRSTASPGFLPGDMGSGHTTFVAGPDGSYEGWFITEPTGNSRFTPGNDVFFRLLLNDGAGGQSAAHILTTAGSARVLRFGSLAGEGSALTGSTTAPPGGFVLVHEETSGSSRPLAVVPIEATGAVVDGNYAGFYRTQVAGLNGRWGTLIPNNLAGGVRRVSAVTFENAEPSDLRLQAAGFPGTVNAGSGLSAIALTGDAGRPVLLPSTAATWQQSGNWSNGLVPNNPALTAIVPVPSSADRAITLDASVVLGGLRFPAQVPGSVNRLRTLTSGPVLVFDGGGTTARIDMESSSAGALAQLDASLPVQLAGDLEVDTGAATLRLAGPLSGHPHGIVKSGSGTLEITASNPSPALPVHVDQGTLLLGGHHPGTLTLASGTVITGQGSAASLTGQGRFEGINGPLTAVSASLPEIRAGLAVAGGTSGNGRLVLTHPTQPLPQAPGTIDLFLPSARAAGDRFAGGLLVPVSFDLASALAGSQVRLFVAEPTGSISWLGQNHRPAGPADQLVWRITSLAEGKTIEVVQLGEPENFQQWRNLHFPDAAARADDGISGPQAAGAPDGVANLIRYAHGVPPGAPVLDWLPRLAGENAGTMTYRFRYDATRGGIAWVVRASSGLGTWTETLFDSRIDDPPAPDGQGWTSLPIPGDREHLFLRLEIILTP